MIICPICKQPVFVFDDKDFVICCNNVIFVTNETHNREIRDKTPFLDERGKIDWVQGYAFMDESGHCIIITYGEGRRDAMSKYLSAKTDEMGIEIFCN